MSKMIIKKTRDYKLTSAEGNRLKDITFETFQAFLISEI